MGLFDFLKPMKVYTAAEVHAEIAAKVVLLMEEMKKRVEAVSLPVEMQDELELLRTTGLTNSRNMKALADAEQQVNSINEERRMTAERIRLIQLLHKHYGPDVMLMRLEDFMALLDKYNLSCGFLEDYKGSIPRKNLEEIAKAKKFVEDVKRAYPVSDDYDSYNDFWAARERYIGSEGGLGFIGKQMFRYKAIEEYTRSFKKAAPYDIRRFPLMNMSDRFGFRTAIESDHRLGRECHVLLIAAPVQEMNNAPKLVERIRTEDPFVFSVAKQGVIIYSAWGDEGNDEVMQKYRKINEWIASCEALKGLEE